MWFFFRKKDSVHYDNDLFDCLNDALKSLGAELVNKEMDIVGSVDLVTFYYKINGESLTVLVESESGIEVCGNKNDILLISNLMNQRSKESESES